MTKYKDALKRLDVLDEKRIEQERLYRELRRSILHHGVASGEFSYRKVWIGPNDRPPRDSCQECGNLFVTSQRFIDFLIDDEVIARYHEECS